MKSDIHSDMTSAILVIMEELRFKYFKPLNDYIEKNPELKNTVPGFLISPSEVTFYVGRTHIAIEYNGSEFLTESNRNEGFSLKTVDYSNEDCNLLEKIIGFEYDCTHDIAFPLLPINEDLVFPTNKGVNLLNSLGWKFYVQNSFTGYNMPTPSAKNGQFTRIINSVFFDENKGSLLTRRIKWMDMIPILFDGSNGGFDTMSINLEFYKNLVEHDAHYQFSVSEDYKYIQLPKINYFIELWGNRESSEPDITSHLNKKDNKFILTMKFGATEAYGELMCDWQSEDRNSIKPDFFIVHPNGYADIVEFKLPHLNKKTIVGGHNREAFSAWLNSYIAQTRVYSTYFDDPNNRIWFEEKYGFKVHKPKRYLVVGRRSDFKSEAWREIISDYNDIEIITFDDLIDSVTVQFYK